MVIANHSARASEVLISRSRIAAAARGQRPPKLVREIKPPCVIAFASLRPLILALYNLPRNYDELGNGSVASSKSPQIFDSRQIEVTSVASLSTARTERRTGESFVAVARERTEGKAAGAWRTTDRFCRVQRTAGSRIPREYCAAVAMPVREWHPDE